MPPRFKLLAWTTAGLTYLLIILGAVVRITGSGMGCGDHWPMCNGRWFPSLDDIGTLIEWSHRLVAALVSILVFALAGYAWWLRRDPNGASERPGVRASYAALGLLILQVLLGAVTVKLELPAGTVVLHFMTAMLLLATLLLAASPPRLGLQAGTWGLVLLAFVTVLFGALTANVGAAAACTGFPLCNGQLVPDGGALVHVHWTHRLLAYGLTVYVGVWGWRRRPWTPTLLALVALVAAQVALGAVTVLLGLPPGLQAAHLAVGTAVWAAVVVTAQQRRSVAGSPAPAYVNGAGLREKAPSPPM